MEHLTISIYVLGMLVLLALIFDFMNGFHDSANAIATVVSTGVLKPQSAVAMAAFFNFVAIFVVNMKVAQTIGKDIIDPHIVDHYVIFGALVGAIVWNIITWYYGIPSSSSHALIGGLVGAGWPPREATLIGAATRSLVLGSTVGSFSRGFTDDVQVYRDRYPHMGQAHLLRGKADQIDTAGFELALTAFIDGLALRFNALP